ncbi:hypothetical protein GGS24DRAFT_346033 [Hypoxylon argillaceum]|nr:hypothetical protein GGS24DRAFT_346033 [Hypoxylon argillaceum]
MATDTDADTDNDTDIFLNELTLAGSSLSPPATTSQQVRSSQAQDLPRAGISREDEGDRTSRTLSERQSHYLAHSDFDWSKHQNLLGCALHLPTQLPPRNDEHGAPDPGVPSSSGAISERADLGPLFGARLTLPTIPETLVSDLSAFFAVGPPSWLPAESATTAYTQYTRMTSDTSKASDNGNLTCEAIPMQNSHGSTADPFKETRFSPKMNPL